MVQSAGQRIYYPDQYFDEYDEKLPGKDYQNLAKERAKLAKEEADRQKELGRGRK
jgi:hypothetical protein